MADDATHCGICGHQLQEGGKKTLFGMAALNAGDFQAAAKAAADARAAVEAAQAAEAEAEDAFAKTEAMPSVAALADKLPGPPISGASSTPEPSIPQSGGADPLPQYESEPSYIGDAPVDPTPQQVVAPEPSFPSSSPEPAS